MPAGPAGRAGTDGTVRCRPGRPGGPARPASRFEVRIDVEAPRGLSFILNTVDDQPARPAWEAGLASLAFSSKLLEVSLIRLGIYKNDN